MGQNGQKMTLVARGGGDRVPGRRDRRYFRPSAAESSPSIGLLPVPAAVPRAAETHYGRLTSGAGWPYRPGGPDPRDFRQAGMKDDQARREKTGTDATDLRQDRLKAALRENLKRRKSQARGRDDLASSDRTDASLDDADEKAGQ
jgi:hypothetical protein